MTTIIEDVVSHDFEEWLLGKAKGLKPITTAVVHPVDIFSLTGAVEAAKMGIIDPILVGPENKMRTTAQEAKINLDDYALLPTPHSHAAAAAAVELVTEKLPSTLDATALCKMAERGQINGAVLDGPLAFDNAVSAEAAALKELKSPVAGDADILVVPDIESGNMLYKQLRYFSGAQGAGIVLGAKVPIILTSRAGNAMNRVVSSALALLYARRKLP